MKIQHLFMVALLVAFGSSTVWGQAQASPEHDILKKDVGVWVAKCSMWMGPGEPSVSEGIERNKMVGDFWLLSEFEGTFGGMEFKGVATTGYDPKSDKYVGSWMDNMNPFASSMVGTYDKDTKTMTTMGSSVDPDGNPVKSKNVTVYKDDGSRMMTMYSQMPGSDELTKTLEIVYTKKSKKEKIAKE